jgi:hypothetical protein
MALEVAPFFLAGRNATVQVAADGGKFLLLPLVTVKN